MAPKSIKPGNLLNFQNSVRVGHRDVDNAVVGNRDTFANDPHATVVAIPIFPDGDNEKGTEIENYPPIPDENVLLGYRLVTKDGQEKFVPRNDLNKPPSSPNTPSHRPHHLAIHDIVQANLPSHLRYFQENPEAESLLPKRIKKLFPNLEATIKARTISPNAVINNQLDNIMPAFAQEVMRAGLSGDSTQTNWTQVTHDAAKRFKKTHPLAADALNKKTLDQIAAHLNQNPPTTQEVVATNAQHIADSLTELRVPDPESKYGDRLVIELFPNAASKNTFMLELFKELEDNAATHPDSTAHEIIRRKLQRHVFANTHIASLQNNQRHIWLSLDQVAAQFAPAAQAYQDAHYQNSPKKLPTYMPRDTFAALGVGRLHKRSPLPLSVLPQVFTGRTSQNLSNKAFDLASKYDFTDPSVQDRFRRSLDPITLGHLEKEFGPHFWQDPFAQARIASFGVLDHTTMSLLSRGYTTDQLDHMIAGARDGLFGSGLGEKDPHLLELIRLREHLSLAEEAISLNPDILSRGHRWQYQFNKLTRNPFRFEYRYRWGRTRAAIRDFSRNNKIMQAPKNLLRPLVILDNFADKINPFIYLDRKYINPLKKQLRDSLKRRAEQMAARVAASRLGKTLAGKLLAKGILAAAGIGTGGIGTAYALLSIARDLYQIAGGWRGLLRLAFMSIAFRLAAAYLLFAKLKSFLMSFLSLIQTLISSPLAWFVAAGISLFTPAAFLAPLFFLGGLITAAISYLPLITQLLSNLFVSLSALLSSIFSTSAVSSVALGTSLVVVGGLGGAGLLTDIQRAEILTLRIAPILDPYPEACWPISGEITQDQHGNICSGGKQIHATDAGGTAIDIAASAGTPIHAMARGIVKITSYDPDGWGNYVMINYPGIGSVIYAHLLSFSVAVGQEVTRGEEIGLVGSTGNSTGPHLHLEFSGGDVANIVPPFNLCDDVESSCFPISTQPNDPQ